MAYALEDIALTLKMARQAKGLSQRELSELTGFTQANISKIETGTVDIKVSSLIELARTLDLELAIIPRRAIPAVQGLVRLSSPPRGQQAPSQVFEEQRPAYQLDGDDDHG